MKKRIAAFLSVLLIICCMPITAFAADDPPAAPSYKTHLPYYYSYDMTEAEQKLYLDLRKNLIAHKTSFTIPGANASLNQLSKCFTVLMENDSLTFDIAGFNYEYTYREYNGVRRPIEFKIKVQYKMSEKNYLIAHSQADKAADKLISTLDTKKGIFTQIMYIHDYIAKKTVYDLDYAYAFTPYGALVKGQALCEGYARAFKLVCEKLSIPVVMAVSPEVGSEAGHAWNKFKAGKNWYVVDITNDDTDSDLYGNIIRDYLFIADSEYTIVNETDDPLINEPVAKDAENSYYSMVKRVFETVADANKYVRDRLPADAKFPVYIEIEFTTYSAAASFMSEKNLRDLVFESKAGRRRNLSIDYLLNDTLPVAHIYISN
jgi:hypothetical protein